MQRVGGGDERIPVMLGPIISLDNRLVSSGHIRPKRSLGCHEMLLSPVGRFHRTAPRLRSISVVPGRSAGPAERQADKVWDFEECGL